MRKGIPICFLPLFFFPFLFCVNQSVEGEEPIRSFTLQSEQTEIHFLSNECKNKKNFWFSFMDPPVLLRTFCPT
ncbi:hypothetical protein LEP1GSC195_0976 [Leptospira wolbachii serovar Codice str. CDC]|uniref:Uncharacterized protein n=1 Tax=Leptospira wolbachii serovar Codice str. CDC TaxID=1218599 RepID=R9ACS2_9LEPT|nr:hypothetical protein LEP1GSC195_0976 [Leptospira wolbachii serovar Codice str. CDC]